MSSWIKRSIALSLSAVMAAGLAACGGKDDKTDAASSAPSGSPAAGAQAGKDAKPVKLRIYWWGAQARHDATLKALELYTKQHPNVTFEPEFSGWDGYFDKLATQAAAKNMPDIIQMDTGYFTDYASRNQLADLNGLNVADIDKTLLEVGKWNNKLYAVPLGSNAFGFVYDKAALEKLGIPLPKEGWTWNDLLGLARQIKPKLGEKQYVLYDYTSDMLAYESYQMSKGKGHAVTLDGKFNIDKQIWTEWVNMFEQLRKEGICPPPEITATHKEFDPKLDMLINGTILFRYAYSSQMTNFDNMKKDTYALVTFPKNAQAGGFLKPSMQWAVSADSKYAEESKKFIDWFLNDKEANEVMLGVRGTPASGKLLTALTDKFSASDKAGIKLIEQTSKDAAIFNAGAKGWSNFRNKEYGTIMQAVQFGKTSLDKGYEELVNKSKEYEKASAK